MISCDRRRHSKNSLPEDNKFQLAVGHYWRVRKNPKGLFIGSYHLATNAGPLTEVIEPNLTVP